MDKPQSILIGLTACLSMIPWQSQAATACLCSELLERCVFKVSNYQSHAATYTYYVRGHTNTEIVFTLPDIPPLANIGVKNKWGWSMHFEETLVKILQMQSITIAPNDAETCRYVGFIYGKPIYGTAKNPCK